MTWFFGLLTKTGPMYRHLSEEEMRLVTEAEEALNSDTWSPRFARTLCESF